MKCYKNIDRYRGRERESTRARVCVYVIECNAYAWYLLMAISQSTLETNHIFPICFTILDKWSEYFSYSNPNWGLLFVHFLLTTTVEAQGIYLLLVTKDE